MLILEAGAAHHVCGGQRSEDDLWESVLSFHYVGPGDRTLVIRLGTTHPYPLSHLPGSPFSYNRNLRKLGFCDKTCVLFGDPLNVRSHIKSIGSRWLEICLEVKSNRESSRYMDLLGQKVEHYRNGELTAICREKTKVTRSRESHTTCSRRHSRANTRATLEP